MTTSPLGISDFNLRAVHRKLLLLRKQQIHHGVMRDPGKTAKEYRYEITNRAFERLEFFIRENA